MKQSTGQTDALVKQPIHLTASHFGERLIDQIFQHTPIRVGRSLDNDVILPFDGISRYHCEIRFQEGHWVAVDLNSKNGITDKTRGRVPELKIDSGTVFGILDVTISLNPEQKSDLTSNFNSVRETNSTTLNNANFQSNQDKFGEASQSFSSHRGSVIEDLEKRRAVLEFNLNESFLTPHRDVLSTPNKAIQMIVLWHDQIIESREIPIQRPISIKIGGELYDLGTAKQNETQIRIPPGGKAIGESRPAILSLTPTTPCAFHVEPNLIVAFRYVPRSMVLIEDDTWIESKLVDPLILSATFHGSVAIMAMVMGNKQSHKPKVEPERFATIISQPPVQKVVVQPTPTPPPPPTPTPTPPPIVVKPTPIKIEKPKVKPAVVEKKIPKIVKKIKKPEPIMKQEEPKPIVTRRDPPPEKINRSAPPPEPVAVKPPPPPAFNAKSVGALKMLSGLTAGPAVANVENIRVSRDPATSERSSRENSTSDLASTLNQSAKAEHRGESAGIAVSGKAYQVGGLSGKAGKRKIGGTVVGGATYSSNSKNDGLSREQVMKVVQAHQSQIQACYERSLMTNPDLIGRADFEWEIEAKGVVKFVNVKSATLKDGENLLDCVKGIFSKMKFPQAKNGEQTTSTIVLPFGRI